MPPIFLAEKEMRPSSRTRVCGWTCRGRKEGSLGGSVVCVCVCEYQQVRKTPKLQHDIPSVSNIKETEHTPGSELRS